jgi:ferric-dicitrate binding protein FerR (iron transport regulator)
MPPLGDAEATAAARVESIVGIVWVRGTDTPVSRFLLADYAVPVGSGLRSSASGRVSLRLSSGHSLTLETLTQLRLLGGDRVALDHGVIHVDSGPTQDVRAALTITTPRGEIRGSEMQVEIRLEDDGLRLRVRDGEVDLVGRDRVWRVVKGSELTVDPEDTVVRRDLVAD